MMLITQILMLLLQDPTPGVIAGRVLDPSGGPLAGVQVQLLQYHYNSHASLGGMSDHPELWVLDNIGGLSPRPSGGQTNDRGEYRFIDVPPGKYFLRVPSPGTGSLMPSEISPFGAKFHPGVEGLTKAEQIEVGAGQEVRLNDIVLTRTTLQPIRVRATGSGLRALLYGGPAPDAPPVTSGLIDGVQAVRPDEPGDYKVCAAVVVAGVARNACTDVVYTGAAMEVALTIPTPTAFLTGRVLVDEQPLAGVAIGARGTGPGSNFGAISGADGSFKSLNTVQEGPAILRSANAPDGFYVSSIRQGTRDVLTDGLLITREDTNLDVRVVKSSSVIQGRVTGGSATVVLLPQGALALRTDKEHTHRVTTTNPNGTFEIRNVIPGKLSRLRVRHDSAGFASRRGGLQVLLKTRHAGGDRQRRQRLD
jgi:hypothetical protein